MEKKKEGKIFVKLQDVLKGLVESPFIRAPGIPFVIKKAFKIIIRV